MTHAIVLIEAERTALPQLGGVLADVDGVAEAYSVTGEWDFVAIVRVPKQERLAEVVTAQIGQLEGVLRAVLCLAGILEYGHERSEHTRIGGSVKAVEVLRRARHVRLGARVGLLQHQHL